MASSGRRHDATENRILATLSLQEQQHLALHLETVILRRGQVLYEPEEVIQRLFRGYGHDFPILNQRGWSNDWSELGGERRSPVLLGRLRGRGAEEDVRFVIGLKLTRQSVTPFPH